MNLVNMKSTDDTAGMTPCPPEAYPYGLRICLGDDQCEALGIKGPIAVGTQLTVMALVTVVRCTQEQEADPAPGDTAPDIMLDLQITDMVGIDAPVKPIDASALYSNSNMKG